MKTYIEHKNDLFFDGMFIPKDESNRHYREFLQLEKAGEAKRVPYVAPAPTWDEIRAQRDALLKESDWTALTDVDPKPSAEAWVQYRQALRDLTSNYSSPEDVVWPTVPQ